MKVKGLRFFPHGLFAATARAALTNMPKRSKMIKPRGAAFRAVRAALNMPTPHTFERQRLVVSNATKRLLLFTLLTKGVKTVHFFITVFTN